MKRTNLVNDLSTPAGSSRSTVLSPDPSAVGVLSFSNQRDEIVTLHTELCGMAKVTVTKAQRIGELLVQVRESLDHGAWLPWLKTNVPFTDRTARNYIRLHENRDRLKLETVSDLTSAYRLCAPPKSAPISAPTPAPDHDFIPEAGCMMLCERHHGDQIETLYITQSATNPGFYFIAYIFDDRSGAQVKGSKKAIHKDHVTDLVMLLPWMPTPSNAQNLYESLSVECYEDPGWKYNEILFTSYNDYLETALGIAKSAEALK